MRLVKWLAPITILIVTLFLLSACGESLQKPTGLDDDKNEQIENNKFDEADDKQRDHAKAADEEKKLDKKPEESEKESNQQKNDKETSNHTSTSDKEVNKEKDSTNKSEHRSPEKKSKDSENKTDKKTKQEEKPPKKDSTDKEKNSKTKNEDKKESKPKKDSNGNTPPSKDEKPSEPENKASFTIQFSSNEVILPSTDVTFEEGDTVLKVFDQITRKNKIQTTIQSSGYVSRIDNIGEKEHGSESGWMYRVNGTFPNIGAAGYTLKDGDIVEWLYTKDLGKDIGAP